MKTFNAVYDITEKDLVALRWEQMKRGSKQVKKINWITKILKLVR